MNVMTITSQSWLNQSASWQTGTLTTSVVRTSGFGMGDVCSPTAGYTSGTSTHKRHADAMKANPVAGRLPWRPPVT